VSFAQLKIGVGGELCTLHFFVSTSWI